MSGQRNAEEIRTSSKLKLAFPSSRHRVSKKLQKLIPVINLPLRFNSSEKILTKIFRVIALQRAHKRFLVKNKDTEESETSNGFLKVKSFSSVRFVHISSTLNLTIFVTYNILRFSTISTRYFVAERYYVNCLLAPKGNK